MAELNWNDDFQTGGENHVVEKTVDGLKLAVKPVLEFHGNSYYGDRVRIQASASLNIAGPMTVLARVARTDSTYRPIVEYAEPGQFGVHQWIAGSFKLYCNYHETTGVHHPLEGRTVLDLGTFYDVGSHYTGITLALFLNGVDDIAINAPAFTPQTNRTLWLGYRPPSLPDARSLAGRISWVAVFAGGLTREQIADLRYRIPKPDEPGLRGYWLLDEGAGTQAKDLSIYANHGTLEGPSETQLPAWVAGEKRMGVRFLTLDLSTVGVAQDSRTEWTATVPSGTGVSIETNLSLDGGRTWQGWQTCANGGPIPGVTPGTDLSNARLKVWEHLHTTNPAAEPVLHRLTISIHSPVSVGRLRRILLVRRSGRIHPVPHRGRVYPLA